jgi:hypothetical protein
MSEHYPQSVGVVKETGTFDNQDGKHLTMRAIAKKIEEHGEVHAVVDGLDDEVELRLGTTLVNYDSGTFEVWDGDNYQSFPVSQIARVYKPMDIFH